MDDDIRTLWCGNLSDKVTEDILYELFLQGGPVQRVSIPKDRDGKQRTYGFITYKHISSIPYALDLFNGTKLFNRTININVRNSVDSSQVEKQRQEPIFNLNHVLQLGHQSLIGNVGNLVQNTGSDMLPINTVPNTIIYTGKIDTHHGDRHSRRIHPYHQDHEKDKHDHRKDHRPYKNRNINNHSSNYSRRSNYTNTRRRH